MAQLIFKLENRVKTQLVLLKNIYGKVMNMDPKNTILANDIGRNTTLPLSNLPIG